MEVEGDRAEMKALRPSKIHWGQEMGCDMAAKDSLCYTQSRMKTAKKEVQQILNRIPNNSTFEDIQYHIYVREKIERGLTDVREGRVLSHREVKKRLSKWL